MMNKITKALLLTAILPFTTSAAQELSPWYVGAGLGVNNYEPSCDQKNMKECGDDSPYAWDVFGGYLFNEYVAVELGYHDLGSTEWTDYSDKRNDVKAKGMSLGLAFFLPISENWSLSAETGAINYILSNNKQWGSEYYSDRGIAPYFGAGIGYNISENFKLQANYRRYENLDDNKWNTLAMESNYWGLELSYRFGSTTPEVITPPVIVITAVDSDNDGVNDNMDKCNNTPINHKVDAVGCSEYHEIIEQREMGSIQFANNSAVINDESVARIGELTAYMEKNPDSSVMITGYASDVGNADYNKALSTRRADTIANILVEQFYINPDRVSAKGLGTTKPIMSGNSIEANKLNRRIEVLVSDTKKIAVLK